MHFQLFVLFVLFRCHWKREKFLVFTYFLFSPPTDIVYTPGNLLGLYYSELPISFDDLSGTPILYQLEPSLSFAQDETSFTGMNDGNRFVAHYSGGFQVKEAGEYRFSLWAADSARLVLGGVSLVEFWEAGSLVGGEKTVTLEVGWYPLEVIYVRSPSQVQLQVWVESPTGEVAPLGGEMVGYDPALPEGTPELEVTSEQGDAAYYSVPVALTANAPVTVACLGDKGEVIYTVDTATSYHEVSAPLIPGTQTSVTFSVKDIWGREKLVALGAVSAPALASYTPGGLLGSYYAGTDLSELRGQRIDPIINMPGGADGDPLGAFGMPSPTNNFSVRWEGAIKVEKAGMYTIYLGSDDGHRMWLDGIQVIYAWNNTNSLVYSEITVDLAEGWHPVTIEMYEANNQPYAYLEWSAPGEAPNFIPSEQLGHVVPESDGETPAVVETYVWFGPESTTGHVVITASELITASMKLTSKGSVSNHTMDVPATAYSYTFTDLPNGKNCEEGVFCGPTSKLEVTLTDLDGNASVEEVVPVVVNVPPEGALMSYDFDGEALDPAWETVTHGKNDNTANWIFQNGVITENGNAHGYSDDGPPDYGTFLWNSGWQMTNGRLVAHVFVGDNDGFGLMYGIQNAGEVSDDPNTWSYYRFSVNWETPPANVVRVDKGKFTVLEENADYRPPLGQWVMLEIERDGDVHTALIDGLPLFKFVDDALTTGGVGVFSWAMTNFQVDFVAVESL